MSSGVFRGYCFTFYYFM